MILEQYIDIGGRDIIPTCNRPEYCDMNDSVRLEMRPEFSQPSANGLSG